MDILLMFAAAVVAALVVGLLLAVGNFTLEGIVDKAFDRAPILVAVVLVAGLIGVWIYDIAQNT